MPNQTPWPWMDTPAVQQIFAAIPDSQDNLRFVGGCVRDAMCGKDVQDIDLATTYPPDSVVNYLTKAGIKVVPTGIDHGTVMAVIDGKGYEITTLRKDIETDGRRAVVSFTKDWREDAARRDFTFNSLYLSLNGDVFDPWNGVDDLTNGLVRFIGKADERIQEDYLRILRFYRFYARFGKADPEEHILLALTKGAKGLADISGERVHSEVCRLLEGPNTLMAIQLMEKTQVLPLVFKSSEASSLLAQLIELEEEYEIPPCAMRRLYAVVGGDVECLSWIKDRWKLSTKERKVLTMLVQLVQHNTEERIHALIYYFGQELTLSSALLSKTITPEIINKIDKWQPVDFPVKGPDVMHQGINEGPEVGDRLKALEAKWVDSHFRLTKEELLKG